MFIDSNLVLADPSVDLSGDTWAGTQWFPDGSGGDTIVDLGDQTALQGALYSTRGIGVGYPLKIHMKWTAASVGMVNGTSFFELWTSANADMSSPDMIAASAYEFPNVQSLIDDPIPGLHGVTVVPDRLKRYIALRNGAATTISGGSLCGFVLLDSQQALSGSAI